MSAAMPPLDILRPRPAEGWRHAVWMALVAHGFLLLALMVSVQWHAAPPKVVEAEMWDQVPVAAKPVAEPPPPPAPAPAPITPPMAPTPTPTPAPEPSPAPVPQPAPAPKPEPPAAPPAPPPKPAEIPLRVEVPKPVPKPPKAEAKPKPAPKPPPKPEPRPVVKPAPAPAPAPKVEAKPTPPKPAEAAKPKPEVKPPVASTSSAQGPSKEEMERERQANIKRMMSNLSPEPSRASTLAAEYAGRIMARIKPNVVFTESIPGNPVARVEVRCAPDGQIIGRKLLASSGSQAWDDAVLRAIDRTEVLPMDEKGKIPPVMDIGFRPKDF